MDIFSKKSSNI